MKKRFQKFICAILLSCSFCLTGCISASDPSAFPAPSGDLTSTAENANDIMKTANNITYYYEDLITLQSEAGLDAIDRENMVVSCFSDAYLFIDPGHNHQYTDHFNQNNYEFYKLVDRQLDVLAQTLTEMIDRFYITEHTPLENQELNNVLLAQRATIKGEDLIINYKGDYITNTPFEENAGSLFQVDDINVVGIPEGSTISSDTLDLTNVVTLGAMADVVTNTQAINSVDAFKVDSVTANAIDGSGLTTEVELNSNFINLSKALFGGKKLGAITIEVTPEGEGATPVEYVYAGFADELNGDSDSETQWSFMETYGLSSNTEIAELKKSLKQELKYRIASALSGISATEGTYAENKSKYEEMLFAIDHIGFTEQDKENVKTKILDEVIGSKLIAKDDTYELAINEYFSYPEESLNISASTQNIDLIKNLFFVEVDPATQEQTPYFQEFQNYKAYKTVIGGLVEQALTLTGTYFRSDTEINETLFPSFPRVQLIVIDARLLMDAVGYEEENGESDDHEDIEADDIPTETEGMELTEKLSQFVNLKAIMFLPKNLIGERTMAVKENDEWLEDENHEQVYKTFIVEGFLLSNIDVVFLSGGSDTAVVQGNYTLKTKNKEIKSQSDAFGVGYEKPDPTVEETYSSTDMIDIEKQKIIESEEDVLKDYRIFGYNGLVIDETGIVVQQIAGEEGAEPTLLPVSISTKGQMGLYNTFTFGTDMYKYLSIDSVVGTGAGYSLNISNFAGENYVLADFSVLEVNGNQESRKVDLNILYLSCETT